jgi:hypothetical protein
MMFGRKKQTSQAPDETTLDRKRLLAVQQSKLARAQRLKVRSSAVASNLTEERTVNHYIQRLKLAYSTGDRHAG